MVDTAVANASSRLLKPLALMLEPLLELEAASGKKKKAKQGPLLLSLLLTVVELAHAACAPAGPRSVCSVATCAAMPRAALASIETVVRQRAMVSASYCASCARRTLWGARAWA